MPDIEVVCFDLGGVLVRAVSNGWVGACEVAGVPIRKEIARLNRHVGLAEWNNQFEMGKLPPDKFIGMLSKVTTYEPAQIVAIFRAWLQELYPGVPELLERLSKTDVILSCLSNTNPIHWQHLITNTKKFGALEMLTHRYASHLIGARKPDLEAYEHVENMLDVDPEGILFFDDRASNIEAAEEAYWQSVTIDPKNDPVGQITRALEEHGVF